MPAAIDALDFIAHPEKHPAQSVCVLFGDEPFLQRHALGKLRQQVVAGEDGEFSVASLLGDEIELSDVLDELSTVALFGGGRRLVIVEDADGFVSQNRAALEQYVAKPKRGSVLVLLVKTWPGSTRLAKSVAETGLAIECKCPPPARLAKWIIQWGKQQHEVRVDSSAADLLMEHVEPDLGLLDQELAKLAAMAGVGGSITAELVEQGVGSWRAKTAWDLFDAALAGQTPEALVQLDRLLLAGEAPIALMGQLSASLRRFGAAVRVLEQAELSGQRGMGLRQALERAGVKSFVLPKAEGQLRRLGRGRASQIFRWLLEADLALKGSSSSPARARLLLEEFIVRLSAAPASTTGASSRGR